MRDFVKLYPYLTNFLLSLATYTLAGLGLIPQAIAVEEITLKLGPLEESIPIAATDQKSSLLTKPVQTLLNQELQVDPALAQQFLEDLFNSRDGEQLLQQLQVLIPNSQPQEIQRTLKDFLMSGQPINILNLLQAYPQKNLKIDMAALATLAANLQVPKLESELISSSLVADLTVANPGQNPLFDPSQLGTEVTYRELRVFQDLSRHRTIAADIYLPAHPQGPMVIMSHGFAADRHFLKYLAYHLASYGITVVAIEHPGSNIHALVAIAQGVGSNNLLPADEFRDRPEDISFVLDELEKLNHTDSYFQGKFNTNQVTVIGHSFGGYTALALAGAQLNPKAIRHFCQNSQPLNRSPADWLQCAASELPYRHLNARDERVVQAIVLNPIIGDLFAQDLAEVKIPVLMLASTADGITPIISHQLPSFGQLKGEKYLLIAQGATHMSVTDISYLSSAMGQSTLVQEVMDERANPLRKMISATGLAFIKQLTPEAFLYKPYLSLDYVQSLSTKGMSLRLTTQLSADINLKIGLLTLNRSSSAQDGKILSPSFFSRLFEPPAQKTGYLEPIFGSLLQQYYQDIQGLS